MAGAPVRVELSEDVAEVVRREASRTGRSEAEVVELAVRRLVAPSILDRLWERAELTEDEATAIAVEEVNAARDRRWPTRQAGTAYQDRSQCRLGLRPADRRG